MIAVQYFFETTRFGGSQRRQPEIVNVDPQLAPVHHRPGLPTISTQLRSARQLRLDRPGRSLPDLVHIVGDLKSRGVAFESITEEIGTGSAAGKLVFHVFALLAEFERDFIRKRTQAELTAARARGREDGRKPKLDVRQICEIRALLKDPDVRVMDVAKRYGVSRATVHKHLNAITPHRCPQCQQCWQVADSAFVSLRSRSGTGDKIKVYCSGGTWCVKSLAMPAQSAGMVPRATGRELIRCN